MGAFYCMNVNGKNGIVWLDAKPDCVCYKIPARHWQQLFCHVENGFNSPRIRYISFLIALANERVNRRVFFPTGVHIEYKKS